MIDMSQAQDPATKKQLLLDISYALLEVGFLYVSNHEVKKSAVDDLVEIIPKLFAQPDCVKDQSALINSPHFLGFSKFGTEMTAKVQDQREQFEFANELPCHNDGRTTPLYTLLQGPNQWPQNDAISNLRQVVEAYISEMQGLASRFLELVTEALQLHPQSLSRFTGPQDRLKVVHYRATLEDGRGGGIQGVGEHKDSSGWMTFLLQASDPTIKGLQALSKDGDWIDIPPIPGTFVVNMGQAFEVVTNGVCKATTHRVLLPPGEYDRYSVPFFQGVRPDLTKNDLKQLWQHFDQDKWQTRESLEGQRIDSPFLNGKYDTWGEAQLRTKIRSHRDVGMKYYSKVFEQYVNDN